MARLAITLIGSFTVTLDGVSITAFESAKIRAMLACLAAEADRPHRREALAELLWPDWPQRSAITNLRNSLVHLRKVIGDRDAQPPFLLIDRESIQLNLEADVWVDVLEFEQGIRDQQTATGDQGIREKGIGEKVQGIETSQSLMPDLQSKINNLQSTISLYRGPFLDGFSLTDNPAFEQWVLARREELQRKMLQVLFRLTEGYEQQGQLEEALSCARRQVELEPWHELGQQQLMRLLALSGQRSAALEQYEALRKALADELKVEPSAETKRLYEAIRDEDIEGIREMGTGVKGIGEMGIGVSPAPYPLPPSPGVPPFKGMQYFDVADADLFFGRETLTARLVGHIRQMVEASEVGAGLSPIPVYSDDGKTDLPLHFLAVVGASGSGKSSVVRAGLAPALQKGAALANGIQPPQGSSAWQFHIITPTAHPLEALAVSLTREVESVTAATTLVDDMSREPRSLHMYARKTLTSNPSPSGRGVGVRGKRCLLLVVDQFEELFTLCRNEAERTAFLDNLLMAAQNEGLTLVVVVLRADFYEHCAQYPRLRQALCTRQEYIGPMDAVELRQAIEQPAHRNGWEFEAGLVDLILRDIGVSEGHPPEPGALPLLEHALLETWQRRSGNTLTLQGYEDAGGVHGAIARTAEGVFSRLAPEQQALARRIFLRLTELGEGTQDTRRRAPLEELAPRLEDAPQVAGLLKTLADARLITLAEDTAEVAHEALIREWPALRQWLSEDREGLYLHRRLTEAAESWAGLERDAGELYRGARLAQALEWAEGHAEDLNALEGEFLQASHAQAEREAAEREALQQRELAAARRLARTQRQRSLVLSVGLLIAIFLGVLSFGFYRQSNTNLDTAQAANTHVAANASTAQAANTLVVANAATAQANASIALGRQAIAQAQLIPLDTWPNIIQSGLLAVEGLQRAPDMVKDLALLQVLGKYGRPVASMVHEGFVNTVALSPDGRWVVSGSTDGTARVWEVGTGVEVSRMTHTGPVNSVAFSPDGRLVVSGSYDETTRVWVAVSGEEVVRYSHAATQGHIQGVLSVAFSPDGRWIVSVGCDKFVRVWDVANNAVVAYMSHNSEVNAVAFSPDGRRVVSGSADGVIRVWEAATGVKVAQMVQGGLVSKVSFSSDGRWVVSGSSDRTARVWEAATGREVSRMTHEGSVNAVAFSPDGRWVVSGGSDRTARVWDAATGVEVARMIHEDLVNAVAFSPDGRRVVSGSQDDTLRVWEAATGVELVRMVHEGPVNAVAFSPDAMRVVSGSSDKTARVWDVTSQTNSVRLAQESSPSVMAFSPDERWIASGDRDGTARVWEAATGVEVRRKTYEGEVSAVAISPDGRWVVSGGSDKTVHVWEAATGAEVASLSHGAVVYALAFSPDGRRVASGSVDGSLRVWEAASGAEVSRMTAMDNVTAVAFSPDGSRIVSGSLDGAIQVWDADAGSEVVRMSLPVKVNALAFSPDGSRIAAGSVDGTGRIWEADTGVEVARFTHVKSVTSVAFSPDGHWVVSGSWDATARVWEVAKGVEIARITHASAVIAAAFSPDGHQVFTGSSDATIQASIWQPQDLATEICTRMSRNFTQAEWKQFFGEAPYHKTCQDLP